MQGSNQAQYFERRAEEERTAAAAARDDRAAQSHRDLARRYERRAHGDDEPANEGQSNRGSLNDDFRIIP